MTANTYDNERETLSALFDGELNGDAARFALKRLGHDEQWRSAFGRWQLCGDVLRGHATAVASSDFAGLVAAAVAREQAPAKAQAPASRALGLSGRRGWIGGALAASVAVAALFVARPLGNGSSPAVPEAAPAQQVADASPARADAAPSPRAPAGPDPVADLGTAAVAVAEVPRRAIERRNSRSQGQRAALRASVRRDPAPIAAAGAAAVIASASSPLAGDALTASSSAGSNANPFRPQHSEAATRPWPRAVLPQYSNAGQLNASYGGASPSFYPFDPGMPQEIAPGMPSNAERNSPPP
jgi:hypothetical protein